MKNLNVIFMGTPDFSVPVLEGLIKETNVILVVTQPDKKVGRKGILTASPVKQLATLNNIKVLQPEKIRNKYEEIIALKPDMIITCAYGQIIPKAILDCPKYGCINVHASLLPKLRGGAPIHHAIIDGYSKTGITIMYMDEKMDSGDIITQEEIIISDSDTTETLHDKLSLIGKNLLLKTIPNIINQTITRTKQDEDEVTFGFNINKEDEIINFSKTTREVFNQVRGLNSWPVGYTMFDGKRMKIYETEISKTNSNLSPGQITAIYEDGIGVKTLDGEIILKTIQLEGKNKMPVKLFLNGIKASEALVGKKLGV